MNLHNDITTFKQAIRAAAQYKGLREIYIEKDYWVTLALYNVFHSEIKEDIVFKGGTALSKCFGKIERFSEDIDLVLLRNETDTGNQLKSKLRKVGKLVSRELPEFYLENITRKMGMNRKTAHSYPHNFNDDFGQVRDCIILETTWLGNPEPHSKQKIHTFIYEMMMDRNQSEMAKKYNLLPFEVLTLDIRRTLCEKIMSLVRFSHTADPIRDLNLKIRHIYDIHQILTDSKLSKFLETEAFEKLLKIVARNDVHSFKNNNEWLSKHPSEAIIFSKTKNVWNKLSKTYHGTFSNLVYGQLPKEPNILKTLEKVSKRIKTIDWTEVENELIIKKE